MIIKTQRATPASFRLIDLAKAGVAMRVMHSPAKPAIHDFFSFNMPHSPFLLGSTSGNAFGMPK
jgi:hypothetical protein